MAFEKLHPGEKVIADYALAIKSLYKYWLTGYYHEDLNDLQYENQLKGISPDGYGGINYYNYMFSDTYDDEDRKSGRSLGEGKEYYAELSIPKAIEKYWPFAEGWEDCVILIGLWYGKNIHTYQGDPPGVNCGNHTGRKKYPCSLFPAPYENYELMDDCTSLCWGTAQFYAATMLQETDPELVKEIMDVHWPPASIEFQPQSVSGPDLYRKVGFDALEYSLDILQPFDIVIGNDSYTGNKTFGHGEIYMGDFGGKRRAMGWGSVHDENKGGMPAGFNDGKYNWIFRLPGTPKYEGKDVEEMVNALKDQIPDEGFPGAGAGVSGPIKEGNSGAT